MSVLDPRSDRPLAAQLADILREEIRTRVRRPGSKLPSEAQFHEQYDVSRTTVRATLGILASEGLIVTRKGFGSYVREHRPIQRVVRNHDHDAHASSGKPVFDAWVEANGQRPSRQMLFAGHGPLPDDVRKHLDLADDVEQIAIRRRLQLIDDEPMIISQSFYPLWYAAGTALEQVGPISQGPDALIEEMGYRFGATRTIHSARMPSRDESRLLTIDVGVPLFRILRIDYEAGTHRPLIVSDDLYRSDRFEFVVDDTTA